MKKKRFTDRTEGRRERVRDTEGPAVCGYWGSDVNRTLHAQEHRRTWVIDSQVLPPIIDPTPGSTLTSTTVTFTGGYASQPGEEHWLSVGYGKSAFVTKDSLFTTLAINRRFSHYRHALIVATP